MLRTELKSIVVLLAMSALAGCQNVAQPWSAAVCGVVPNEWPADASGPVAVPLPADLAKQSTLLAEITIEGRKQTVVGQTGEGPCGNPVAWLPIDVIPADRGQAVSVRFKAGASNGSPALKAQTALPHVTITKNDGPTVLQYWHGPYMYKHPKYAKPWALTDFIHPLVGLDGETLTDLCPADHLHHRGVFWAWVRHEHDGKNVGSWWIPEDMTCDPGAVSSVSGPVFAGFSASHCLRPENKDGTAGEGLLRNDVTCRVFPETKAGRAVDIDVALRALADDVRIGGTLTLGKGYGGLTVRFAPCQDKRIEADGQLLKEDGVRHRARWADFSAIFAGPDGNPLRHRSGIAVLTHPSHPDYPPEWLLRYYGVLSVCYPSLDMLVVPKDKPLRLSYRLWIHRGDAGEADIEAQSRVYGSNWQWRTAGADGT